MQPILFYLFSAILIIAALLVITIRNPIHSTLFLVLAFFTSAMLWILLEAEFLALSLVLVYVGAVMVLFLFVIMMLDINLTVLREGFARYLPVGALIAVVIVLEMSLVLGPENFGLEKMPVPEKHSLDYSNTKALGSVLYTDYVFAFEVASVILLVAIVAAIALTLRSRPDSKYQEPGLQVRVRRADRIRMVDLKEKQ
ncbi:MAG: NADH-quinone oxidoreductase subunit J [Gammaproteobacteria bacterium]|nr:MAG: NADH-quinone oxidoreductase subunit J [Gammaproteobacteria bacterium]